MAESNHENTILNHLNQHIQDLEQRLSYPKNNWKRQEDLTQQLSEAQKRLGAIAGRSPRRQSVRSQGFEGDRSRNTTVIRTVSGRRPTGGDRPQSKRLSVDYC